MDPFSFLLEDPLYHLTHDVYVFDPSEFPLDFPNPEPHQEHEHLAADHQTAPNNSIDHDISLIDEGFLINGDAMNGDRKRRKKEKPKAKEKEKEKMEIHREVERQRRQEMASLHRSLRSLLPAEYLKGKRSMSDHLHETVKYIRHLKVKAQALRDKRDDLKGGSEVDRSSIPDIDNIRESRGGSLGQCAERVVVKACRDGVEVLIGVNGQEEESCVALSTSRVLKALMNEGLDVTSCISTNTHNDKWVHCVQAQAGDGSNVYTELQQRLTKKLCA